MIRKLLWVAACCTAAAVQAQTPAEIELLSAQKNYQATLADQAGKLKRTGEVQMQLKAAQSRLSQAQADVSRLQQEAAAAETAKTEADSAFAAAGSRLDAAWAAVRGQ